MLIKRNNPRETNENELMKMAMVSSSDIFKDREHLLNKHGGEGNSPGNHKEE